MNNLVEYNLFNFEDIITVGREGSLLQGIVHDDLTLEEAAEALLHHHSLVQVGVDHTFAGFYSLDALGTIQGRPTVEVHAFLLPEFRKLSEPLLRHFRDFLVGVADYEAIVTTVPSHHKHVERLLTKLGFEKFDVQEGAYTKNGEEGSLALFHYLKKGE